MVVERQWDYELRYFISIGGRNFPQGSDVRDFIILYHLIGPNIWYPPDIVEFTNDAIVENEISPFDYSVRRLVMPREIASVSQ